jgi:hypothetical protein
VVRFCPALDDIDAVVWTCSADAVSSGGDRRHVPCRYSPERNFVIGLVVCIFFAVQIFMYPKNSSDMGKWVPIGLALLPLSLLCALVIW